MDRENIDHDRDGHVRSLKSHAGDFRTHQSAMPPENVGGRLRDRLDPSSSTDAITAGLPPDPLGSGPAAAHSAADGPVGPDETVLVRQQAGLAMLFALSVQAPFVWSEARTALVSATPASPPRPGAGPAEEDDLGDRQLGKGRTGEHRMLPAKLGADHLVRNSLYLMLSSGLQAALGFIFWIIMARLFAPEDVGLASALISATSLIAYFALFGLNSSLVRYLPTAENQSSLITGAFLLVAGCGSVIGLAYVLLTPIFAPRLSFISHRPILTVGFVALTAAAAINLLTDSVFIASRRAGLCALTDGGFGGLSKISFGLLFAGGGAYGLFCAAGCGFATAAVVSVILIATTLHWRPSVREPFRALKPLLRFSSANYLANVLNLLPSVVVPIIVLDRLGARSAAYYFVAFQIAALLYAAVQAVEQAFLSEGSQAGADWRKIRNRSRRLAIILFVPGCAVLVVTARWVLLFFGGRYSQEGTTSLELLAVAVIPIALCNWSWTVLRLAGRLRALVFSNAVFAIAICGTAWMLAPRGLTALAAAWPIGCAIAAIVATGAASPVSYKATARHRRRPRRGVVTTGRPKTPTPVFRLGDD